MKMKHIGWVVMFKWDDVGWDAENHTIGRTRLWAIDNFSLDSEEHGISGNYENLRRQGLAKCVKVYVEKE